MHMICFFFSVWVSGLLLPRCNLCCFILFLCSHVYCCSIVNSIVFVAYCCRNVLFPPVCKHYTDSVFFFCFVVYFFFRHKFSFSFDVGLLFIRLDILLVYDCDRDQPAIIKRWFPFRIKKDIHNRTMQTVHRLNYVDDFCCFICVLSACDDPCVCVRKRIE